MLVCTGIDINPFVLYRVSLLQAVNTTAGLRINKEHVNVGKCIGNRVYFSCSARRLASTCAVVLTYQLRFEARTSARLCI
jgi:hypothetical protein